MINELGRQSRTTSAITRTYPGVHPFLLLLIPLVGLQVLVGAAGFFFSTVDSMSVPGWLILTSALVFGSAGVIVAVSGRWDPRTAPLAGVFLAIASAMAISLISHSDSSGHHQLLGWWISALHVEALFPFFLWWFAEQFPRVVRLERRGVWIAWVKRLSLGIGIVLLTVNAVHWLMPTALAFDTIAPFLLRGTTTFYWFLILALALPATLVVFARLRHTEDDERRRAKLFVFGLALGIMPMIVAVLAEVVFPSWAAVMSVPRNRMIGSFVVYGFLLTIPLTCGYSAVTRRVLDLRFVVSRAARVALAKSTLWTLSVAPWLILASVLWLNRERSLAEVFRSPAFLPLMAVGLVGIGLIVSRDRLLAGVDRSLHGPRETVGAAIASLAQRLSTARDTAELAEVIQEHASSMLRAESCALLLLNKVDRRFVSPHPRCRHLDTDSAIARLAEISTDPISTEVRDPDSWMPWLPEPDRLWIADADIRLVMPVSDSSAETIALIAFGPSKTGIGYHRTQRETASAIASAVSLAMARIGTDAEGVFPAAAGPVEDPAGECLACGRVWEASDGQCECGQSLKPAAIPYCLGGKFQLERVLGRGGMGVVYLARDLSLDRRVALKTLPRMSSAPLLRLRLEARSMASFVHPNLAMIFGSETWRGIPVLVVEYLNGGPLSLRVSRGNDPWFVAELGHKLAGAIGALHEKGMLHRDVKPANIGFSDEVEPKLLDFGLAHIIEESRAGLDRTLDLSVVTNGDRANPRLTRTDHVVGTPLYLSPEVLMGSRPSPEQDLWALHVVLWETLAGRHPLEGMSRDDALNLVRSGQMPSIAHERPDCPRALAEALDRGLSHDLASRPSSAWGLQADLDGVMAELRP